MLEFLNGVLEGVMKLITSIRWYDIVDIVFVALVLYYLIKILRQTRAFHLVKGIVLMGAIYLVVSALNMNASSYIFSQFFGNIVVVMLLLFQPEIRHTVESFGRGDFKKFSIFSSKSSNLLEGEIESAANNIARAAANMSDKKVGALIVIEGKSLLGDVLSTGSDIDSSVSSIMLENIFFPKSPLHDGAVVIRDNRIHSAGCILPLTDREVSAELGTRHRAALGMSEQSDALIIVVSEETGAVSIANSGSLERNVSSGELIETITDFLKIDSAEGGRAFKILRRKK